MAYIDTSVLAAYYCPERLSGKVQKALAEVNSPTISQLVELELHSAVAQKVRSREFDAATAGRVISQFRLHLSDGHYDVVPIEVREYDLARTWIGSFSSPLRTLDALHLAVAFSNGLTLLTSDKSLARSAKSFGVKHELLS